MRSARSIYASMNALVILLLSCFYLGGQEQESNRTIISGKWSDACPCKIPCPCWKTHKSAARRCVNFHVFHIQSGQYSGVDLAGSIFVLVNLPLALGQAPVPATLFIDTADLKKASAIEDSLRTLFGFTPANVTVAPIRYRESGKTERLWIPGLLSYKVSFEHKRSLSSEVSENLYEWLSDPKQGLVESLIYLPQGQDPVEYSQTNALFGYFRISMQKQ